MFGSAKPTRRYDIPARRSQECYILGILLFRVVLSKSKETKQKHQ